MFETNQESKLHDLIIKLMDNLATSRQLKNTEDVQKWLIQQFDADNNDNAACALNPDNCSLSDFAWFYMKNMHEILELHTRPFSAFEAIESEVIKPETTTPIPKNQAKGRRSGGAQNRSFNDTNHSDRSYNSFVTNSTPIRNRNHNSSFPENVSNYSMHNNSNNSTPANNSQSNRSYHQHQQNQDQHNQHQSFNQQNNYASPNSNQMQNQQRQVSARQALNHPTPPHGQRHHQNHVTPSNSQNHNQHRNQHNNSNARHSDQGNTPPSGGGRSRSSVMGGHSLNLGDFIISTPPSRFSRQNSTQNNDPDQDDFADNRLPKKRVQIKTVARALKSSANEPVAPPLFCSSNGNHGIFNNSPRSPQSRRHNDPHLCNPSFEENTESPEHLGPVSRLEKKVDMSSVYHIEVLQNAALIYSSLLDLNFSPNILYELSFLISILNLSKAANVKTSPHLDTWAILHDPQIYFFAEFQAALRDLPNALYFTLCVLHYQKPFLALMDVKSLVAIHQIEGISLSKDLRFFIENVIHYKKQLIRSNQTFSSLAFSSRAASTFKTVYFQVEKDSKDCFPNDNDFGAFKSQRDLFYNMLKVWEENHMCASWNCRAKLKPKIDEIFGISENLVNMTHLAQLFVSQLISSALESTTPDEIGFKLEGEKLKHLIHRFVVPGTLGSDYVFPRSLEFFKEFICIAQSSVFSEQLKLVLFTQLITLNNSTIEHINLANENDIETTLNPKNHQGFQEEDEYIVRPDILASMLVLSKFLGLVYAKPFQPGSFYSDGIMSIKLQHILEKQQIELRSMVAPPFDVSVIVQEAIDNKRLLITLPWLVQYLGMLDNISLQLNHTTKALHLIFDIYLDLKKMEKTKCLSPTSAFIIRCCISWLLERNPMIYQMFCMYRVTDTRSLHYIHFGKNATYMNLLSPNHDFVKAEFTEEIDELMPNTHPALECLINVSCPFLQEFRITIKPLISSKAANSKPLASSKMFETNIKKPKAPPTEDDKQTKLLNVFLQSQSASNKTMIQYIIERSFKAVVRDAQLSILAKSKSDADEEVNKITSTQLNEVTNAVEQIYAKAQKDVFIEWDAFVPKEVHKRIIQSLDALLPTETLQVVKDTFTHIIKQEALNKIAQWRHENLVKNNFYYSNLQDMCKKIVKMNTKTQLAATASTELEILPESDSISDLLDELQYWLHCAAMRPRVLQTSTEIIQLLEKFVEAFENTLPPIFYRIVGFYVLELVKRLISHHSYLVTREVLNAACLIWTHPNMQHDVLFEASKDKSVDLLSNGEGLSKNIFTNLITNCYIKSLGEDERHFDKLTNLLIMLIKKKLVGLDTINSFLLPIFKEDFSPDVFNLISHMLTDISEAAESMPSDPYSYNDNNNDDYDDNKSRLMMEVLADFSRDLDQFE